jgi:hypothetical protein
MTRTLPLLALALALGACAGDPAPDATTDVSVDLPNAERGESADDERGEADQVAPPTAVADAFRAAHGDAAGVEWTMEEGGYEASFTEGGNDMSIVYAADGTPGAVETEIAVADLPAAVTTALARDHAGHPVTEAARIVTDGQTTYEAEVSMDGTTKDLIYREDGTLVETAAAE